MWNGTSKVSASGAKSPILRVVPGLLCVLLAAACGPREDRDPDIARDVSKPRDVPVSRPEDVGPADPGGEDLAEPVELPPPLKGFGEPCQKPAECESGFCVPHVGQNVCSRMCVQDCEPGWVCTQVKVTGADFMMVCSSRYWALCRPCQDASDCLSNAGELEGCLRYGPQGRFCGGTCAVTDDCPEGYECQDVGEASRQCLRVDGDCPCLPGMAGLKTTCERVNEFGSCTGVRTCTAQGYEACDAAVPEREICDKKDNDCDGLTDEDEICCVCGDRRCEASCGEDLATCSCDCAACGDGTCSPCGEDPETCPEDCCGSCGDGRCIGFRCGESASVCPKDCATPCGNQVCDKGETPQSCAIDCAWQACGNGVCEASDGGPEGCPQDCDPGCGDCECAQGEDWLRCPQDCGYCGDGVCSLCPGLHEGPASCPLDCGVGVEVCNGKDDDGDGQTDPEGAAGCLDYHRDADRDGYGTAESRCLCRPDGEYTAPKPSAAKPADCRDDDPFVHPGMGEACNGIDDDCNGETDPRGSDGCTVRYADADGDTWGSTAQPRCLCAPISPYTATRTGDCDDGAAAVHPEAPERCDGADDDCDGATDEGFGVGEACDGPDEDRCARGTLACNLEGTAVACVGDGPASPETCDGADDDCDGATDEGFVLTDWDGTPRGQGETCGTGVCQGGQVVCAGTGQGVECSTANLAGPEQCDGLDNDCDGATDDGPLCDDGDACTADTCRGAGGCGRSWVAGCGPGCDSHRGCTVDQACLEALGASRTCDPAVDGDPVTGLPSCRCTALAGTRYDRTVGLPAAIPDGDPAGVVVGVVVPAGGVIEGLKVRLEVAHPAVGDLRVRLCHGGVCATLRNLRGGATPGFLDVYDFDAVDGPGALKDFQWKPAGGDWTATVSDLLPGDVGTVQAVSLFLETVPCHQDLDCDDGLGCTVDTCVMPGPTCSHAPRTCRPSEDPCRVAACNPGTGECESVPGGDGAPCADDGNPCTRDECQAGSCIHPVQEGCGGVCGGSHPWDPGDGACGAPEACVGGLGGASAGQCLPICVGADCVQALSGAVDLPIDETLGCTVSPLEVASAATWVAEAFVKVRLSHSYLGDLAIDLIDPEGAVHPLWNHVGGANADLAATFGASFPLPVSGIPTAGLDLCGLRGEKAAGTWHLRVCDTGTGNGGVLHDWGLFLRTGEDPALNPGHRCGDAIDLGAVDIVPARTVDGTTECALNAITDGACGGSTGPDRTYRLRLPAEKRVTIRLLQPDRDLVLTVKESNPDGSCKAGSTVCSHVAGAGAVPEVVDTRLPAGDWFVAVDSNTGPYDRGPFRMEVRVRTLLPDGAGCVDPIWGPQDLDCLSLYCQNGYCCGAGDCCPGSTWTVPPDGADPRAIRTDPDWISANAACPAVHRREPTCTDAAGCQGDRGDANCVDHQCVLSRVDDDTACDATVLAAECGAFLPVYCGDVGPFPPSAQFRPTCPTGCLVDTDCDVAFHCDPAVATDPDSLVPGTMGCQADRGNGATCNEHSDCQSGHCQNGFCCDVGDCCPTDDAAGALACPAQWTVAPVCDDASTCEGHRYDPVCVNHQCGSVAVRDDCACGGLLSDNCGAFTGVVCAEAPSCPATAAGGGDWVAGDPACRTDCLTGGLEDDTQCDDVAHCDPDRATPNQSSAVCQPDLGNDEPCDDAGDCLSGSCQDGFCCDAGGCCAGCRVTAMLASTTGAAGDVDTPVGRLTVSFGQGRVVGRMQQGVQPMVDLGLLATAVIHQGCYDLVRDGRETDVDCGGGVCPTCAVGRECAQGARDCTTGTCTDGRCR